MVKQVTVALAVVAVMAGLGGAASAKNTKSPTDAMFVKMASQGNIAEVMTSKLALTRSHNSDVKMVAKMLIKDHGTAQSDAKKTLTKAGYVVPSRTDPTHMAKYRMLSRMHGASFDKAFMSGQVKDHDKTVALFKYELSKGADSNAREYAQKYLPAIQGHTVMIHNVASNINADPSKMHNMKTSSKMGKM